MLGSRLHRKFDLVYLIAFSIGVFWFSYSLWTASKIRYIHTMAAAKQERKLPFGKIEPNSAKYFASCMVGGIIGRFLCVGDGLIVGQC